MKEVLLKARKKFMKQHLIIILLLSGFLSGGTARALTHEDEVHLAAHVGTSFALQTMFYGFNSRVLKMNKPWSIGVAAVETLAVGFLYKLSENADAASTRRAMFQNTLGVGLAVGTHIVFRF